MEWFLLLAILACPLVMGVMMFLMWRGMRGHDGRRERATGSEGEAAGG